VSGGRRRDLRVWVWVWVWVGTCGNVEIGLALFFVCGPAFPRGTGAAVPGCIGAPWELGVGEEGIRSADAAGGLGAVAVSDVPLWWPLRSGLLRGINGHAAGGSRYFDRWGCWRARVMSVAAAARRPALRLVDRVFVVPFCPSDGRDRRELLMWGAVGAVSVVCAGRGWRRLGLRAMGGETGGRCGCRREGQATVGTVRYGGGVGAGGLQWSTADGRALFLIRVFRVIRGWLSLFSLCVLCVLCALCVGSGCCAVAGRRAAGARGWTEGRRGGGERRRGASEMRGDRSRRAHFK
jgi:hypothetical protein